ncbi:MAG: hypothetical protein AAF614_31570 [Chloroflexota bacterium]
MRDYTTLMNTMRETGIGLGAISGAWWHPATEPFVMGEAENARLREIGRALFQFLDAVAAELHENPNGRFAQRLSHKVPADILAHLDLAPVHMFRPDFQIVPTNNGLDFVLTEIEIAPFSEGCAHAMQLAYGVSPDVVPAFAQWLAGRELLFVGTHEWSIYQFDQLAFCKALAAHGAKGRVLYDRETAVMEAEIQAGQRWQLPLREVPQKLENWEPTMLGQIGRYGLAPYACDEWPEDASNSVIFRFGYVENFAPQHRAFFQRWQQQGASFMNPFSYHLDNKVTLEGVRTEGIRQRLDANTVSVLESCVPETRQVTADAVPDFTAQKDDWLIKFAGFDQDNAAWGGASVKFGHEYTLLEWRDLLIKASQLAWPVVAQRIVPSQPLSLDFYRRDGSVGRLQDGVTRQRTFFLRDDNDAIHCGSHLTLTNGELRVSEDSNSVQTPVVFSVGARQMGEARPTV